MNHKKQLFNIQKINRIKINIASTDLIKNWSKRDQIVEFEIFSSNHKRKYSLKKTTFGEIKSPIFLEETRNGFEFHKDGLFSEVIFGPLINLKCLCRKKATKTNLFKDCSICGVSVTFNQIRNYRMGYISLITPVFNPLFSSHISTLVKILTDTKNEIIIKLMELEFNNKNDVKYSIKLNKLLKLLKSASNASCGQVQHVDEIREIDQYLSWFALSLNNEIVEKDLNFYIKKYISLFRKNKIIYLKDYFNELFFKFLSNYDILKELRLVHQFAGDSYSLNFPRNSILIKKLRLLENFYNTKTNLSSIMLKAIPVTPPNLRPFDPDDFDGSMSSKINYLYQNIIIINERLQALNFINIPNKIYVLLNEIKLLQESVNYLLFNSKISKNKSTNNRIFSSLSEILRGKEGRFRKSILGKRINFSARTVITVNPLLRITHCAIPLQILKNLLSFKIKKVMEKIDKNLLFKVKNLNIFYLEVLKKLIKHETVMLNRAPTLHKLGIQAFNVIITTTDAIQLHPLVCAAYNADFDGDQMAIYLPLTKISQIELNFIMKSTRELFMFSNSNLKMKPTQELILGLNYLGHQTHIFRSFSFGHYFNNYDEFFECFALKKLRIFDPIWMSHNSLKKHDLNTIFIKNGYIRITPGQLIVNKVLKNCN